MWNDGDYYFPDQELRYRPALGWQPRMHRFPPPYGRPRDGPPPFMKPDMRGMGMGMGPGMGPPFRPPRMMAPDLITPHAAPSMRPMRAPRPSMAPLYHDFSAPSLPSSINISVQTSALKCRIDWNHPRFSKPLKYMYKLEMWEALQCETFDLPAHTTFFVMKTTPGAWYKVELTSRDAAGNTIAVGRTTVKAVFSHEEMQQLYRKSLEFVGTVMHGFRVLYRCKPKVYYDDIQFRCGGIMEKYLKDNNGQAASSINGAISGLFFSARLLPDGNLPAHSPFGNVRMLVPAMMLLDPNRTNMYFSDFYCNYITHYVTVVICEKRSDTDLFCMQRLIKLSPENNPFLRVIVRPPTFEPEFWVNKNVWVEIYYTENVPLSWGRFDTIIATGAGTSRIGGLPHNKQCQLCNLYPHKAASAKAQIPGKLNSTFQLLLSLEKKRLGSDVVEESAELIEALCSLIDSVVEQLVDYPTGENNKENAPPKQAKSPLEILKHVDTVVSSSEVKLVKDCLKNTVIQLDEAFTKAETLLKELEETFNNNNNNDEDDGDDDREDEEEG